MNIDQALIALCEKHDLETISVNVSRSAHHENGFYAYSNAHWKNSGGTCASGRGNNVVEAVAAAITEANVKRVCVVDVPAMELECGA